MNVMIGITGHTKGLGQHLFNQFQKNYHVKGFSRSNGFDIKNPNNRKKIYEQIKDCNIFINLVHNYYHQTDVLFELFQEWENQEKLIINVSSQVVDSDDWGMDRYDYIEYKNQKQNMENMSRTLQNKNVKPSVVNYRISEINFQADFTNLNNIINEFKLHKK
tara:strand:+ start:1460 stop:1945 length:486 start_codon:yes stop_codon:yes gene_type:complete